MAPPVAVRRPSPGPFVLAIALVAVACTGGSDPSTVSFSPPASGAVTPSLTASSLPGRLLLKDGTGSLVTVRPDGTDLVTLAEQTPGTLQVLQAAWSPDGTRVAWAQLSAGAQAPAAQLMTSGPRGEDLLETPMPVPAFYLSWDPTSSRVAYLAPAGPDIQMGVVEQPQPKGQPVTPIARGSPFYFSWGPDGDRMLVHVGQNRLDELSLDGTTRVVDARPGAFQAPVWSLDGTTFVYAVRGADAGQQRLVVRRAGGGAPQVIATPSGAVSFVVSPDGRRVAYQALGTNEQDLYDRDLPTRATDVGVTVVDTTTTETVRVTTGPAVAFSWSPAGDRLAVLEPIYHPTGQMYFRWVVWNGEETFLTGAFTPSLSLLSEYAPFFSQYAQSSTIWAPDGSAFAYPADSPSGPPVVWVQPADGSAAAFPVGQGSFVAWSPSTAAE
jgi:Tol biopolymer transport system component